MVLEQVSKHQHVRKELAGYKDRRRHEAQGSRWRGEQVRAQMAGGSQGSAKKKKICAADCTAEKKVHHLARKTAGTCRKSSMAKPTSARPSPGLESES